MKILIFIISALAFGADIKVTDLKVGDILLQPLHCYSCNLIEAQTRSEYSHIGVIVSSSKGQILVAEAFKKVRVVSLKEFNKKTQKGLKLEVLRPHYVSDNLYRDYRENFDGLPYDSMFLWGDESIYCSELVQKLFAKSGMLTPNPKPMSFDTNPEYWDRYFRGETPRGKLGISPEDFKLSKLFVELGFYEAK